MQKILTTDYLVHCYSSKVFFLMLLNPMVSAQLVQKIPSHWQSVVAKNARGHVPVYVK